jgi:hypothetical protein
MPWKAFFAMQTSIHQYCKHLSIDINVGCHLRRRKNFASKEEDSEVSAYVSH